MSWRIRHKLQSTENFIDAIKTVQVPDNHKLVFSDVKSLFTSIPLQLALDCTETAINNSTLQLLLLANDLMDLLNLSKTKANVTDRQGALYKIKCSDCQATYIGETGRNLSTRLAEPGRDKVSMAVIKDALPCIFLLWPKEWTVL